MNEVFIKFCLKVKHPNVVSRLNLPAYENRSRLESHRCD